MLKFLLAFIPRAVTQGIPLMFGCVGETITEKSGNLKPLADKAQDNNAGLTDDEYNELCKAILGITLDKAGIHNAGQVIILMLHSTG